MTHRNPRVPARVVADLGPLLSAEAGAEAPAGVDARDLEQAVWVRLLEQVAERGAPERPADWLRRAVREEAVLARRAAVRGLPYREGPAESGATPESAALRAERRRVLRDAVARTPGNCPRLLTAMLSSEDLTYREIAGELGISQGSLGPMRSRCLGCLRRMLATEVAAPERRGKER
ncbi:sigma-70 family RNA polymerase sigma factor [Streptomyces sp. NPDC001941]|uniref:sigma-70 family RNA polymerase sigma factor n=1 Tax=Streptomyces sp. NPDC001941 TaxID=3154659 RepID=UPI003325349E